MSWNVTRCPYDIVQRGHHYHVSECNTVWCPHDIVQRGHHYHVMECNTVSPLYSTKMTSISCNGMQHSVPMI